jgi:hypothetical protein
MLNEEGRRPSLLESLKRSFQRPDIKSDAVADWWTSPTVMRIRLFSYDGRLLSRISILTELSRRVVSLTTALVQPVNLPQVV